MSMDCNNCVKINTKNMKALVGIAHKTKEMATLAFYSAATLQVKRVVRGLGWKCDKGSGLSPYLYARTILDPLEYIVTLEQASLLRSPDERQQNLYKAIIHTFVQENKTDAANQFEKYAEQEFGSFSCDTPIRKLIKIMSDLQSASLLFIPAKDGTFCKWFDSMPESVSEWLLATFPSNEFHSGTDGDYLSNCPKVIRNEFSELIVERKIDPSIADEVKYLIGGYFASRKRDEINACLPKTTWSLNGLTFSLSPTISETDFIEYAFLEALTGGKNI